MSASFVWGAGPLASPFDLYSGPSNQEELSNSSPAPVLTLAVPTVYAPTLSTRIPPYGGLVSASPVANGTALETRVSEVLGE